jgi:hypothetical protein
LPSLVKPTRKQQWVGFLIGLGAVLVPAIWIALMMNSSTVLHWSEGPLDAIARWIHRSLDNVPPATGLLWLPLAPFAAALAVIIVHELGHAVVGVLAGFRLLSIQFGPLQISPPFHLKWKSKLRLPGASGMAVLLPTRIDGLRYRGVAMILGGPLANLLSAAVVILLMPQMGWFTGLFVGLSVLTGVGNLVPFRKRALTSDGKRILMLLRNGPQGERWLAILQLVADLRNGVEPEDLRLDFLTIATAVQDDSLETASAYGIAHAAAYYRHDDAEAARLLEVSLQHSGCQPPMMREAIFSDAANFQAKRRRRADLAKHWLAELPQKPVMPELHVKTESAILAAEGDIQGALKKFDEAVAIVEKSADPQRRDLTLRLMRRTRKELEAQL